MHPHCRDMGGTGEEWEAVLLVVDEAATALGSFHFFAIYIEKSQPPTVHPFSSVYGRERMAEEDEVGREVIRVRRRRLHPPECDGTWKPFQYNRSFLCASPQFGLQTDAPHTTRICGLLVQCPYNAPTMVRARAEGLRWGRKLAGELCKNGRELWKKCAHIKRVARCLSKGLLSLCTAAEEGLLVEARRRGRVSPSP